MSRVLVVTNDFPTRRGGIESFVYALCERMPADEVVVYTSSMPGDREHDATLPFVVYRDPTRMLLPTPGVARRVETVLRRHGCERVLFGASAPLGLLAPRLRRAGAQRIVALTHGHEVWWSRVPVTRQLMRRIGDSVDVLTYVSEWCRRGIAPALSARGRDRMRRLSPGVDLERFRPGVGGDAVRRRWGIAPDAPVVVCLARMVRRKGQDRLLEAWPEVRREHPDAVLLLVGDGPDRQRLERLAVESGEQASVVFTGSIPWDEVPAHMDAGDVFAMPCRTRRLGLEVEAWGIVFLEAQACGLPVVIGRSGGAPETLLDGAAGAVVDAEESVAEALVGLLAKPPARAVPPSLSALGWDAVSGRLGELFRA
ncbi:MAG: glycosyltransferase family 4 protein [Nocardioidaceae bacterium]|nr:glycosyltransferase family 4 protein [Nocardioidaceae bacterium]